MQPISWLKQRLFPPPAGRSLLTHAPQPLAITTPDGSGQATHPDVLFFAQPWRSYSYWMAMTPYPFMDDRQENPCILTSQDGHHWQKPTGGNNPLVPTPARGFHADPDLVYHPPADELWLYYLHTVRQERQWLKRLRSRDGRHWTTPEVILELPYQEIRSPTIVFEQGHFLMWSVNMTGGRVLELRQSTDGTDWSPPRLVSCPLPDHTPSHVDVIKIADQWGMIIQATPNRGGPNPLYWRQSREGLHWQGPLRPLLATEDGPPWSRQTLYRATAAPLGDAFALWYGGRAPGGINHIAMTTFSVDHLANRSNPWSTP